MSNWSDIFGPGSNYENRFIPDYTELAEKISAARRLGKKIVLTQGTYDLLHIGHVRYLEAAKDLGDILVIGVDSDDKVRSRKGPHRPIVPEEERLFMLANLRSVDLITLKPNNGEKWTLIKQVRPDVLVVSKTTKKYPPEELAALREFCGEVVLLDPQATTSTTARIRLLLIQPREEIQRALDQAGQNISRELLNITSIVDQLFGGKSESSS